MKQAIATLLCLLAGVAVVSAQPKYHRDINTTSVNAQTQRQELIFYPSQEAALEGLRGGPEGNPYYQNLNGVWDFAYFADGEKIPEDLASISEWNSIKVPGNWEVQGFGYPIYTNIPYEFAPVNPQPPQLPDAIEAGVYRRHFNVPEDWRDGNVYLTVAGASAGVYIYVNNHFAGYCEDSKAAARYNIGKYLESGDNELIIKIFRQSTGSYLECQDFWRISGIERDVYLTYEKGVPEEFTLRVVSTLDEALDNGILKFSQPKRTKDFPFCLLDGEKEILSGTTSDQYSIPGVKHWSAETPHLYTLVVKVGEMYTAMDVGFRRIELSRLVRDGKEYPVLLVNGQPVKFKGVNYHEHNPLTGHYVDKQLILKDLMLMKRMNINAIRTCHYPQQREFYELCDRLGFYVYDEANIESHGMGYRLDRTLGNNPKWSAKHLDRVMNMYNRTASFPCVTILSLGNEAGNGVNFYDCYRFVKMFEADGMDRPVCYERAEREWNTDMLVPQYPGAEWFRKMGEEGSDRPVVPSEYAHAMGNSTGSLDWQWNQIYSYPNLQGGFIWDWVDQGLLETDDAGRSYFTYGGDYGKNLPSDGNFLCNGIVNPDREPHPASAEVSWNYQNVKIEPVSLEEGRFEVFNRFYFKSLQGMPIVWTFERNGKRIAGGRLTLETPAGQKETIELRAAARQSAEGGIYKFFVMDGGEIIARDAFELPVQLKPYKYSFKGVQIIDDGSNITISGGKATAVFDKSKGLLMRYNYAGKELIDSDFGLRPNFWRAPTDNDYGNGWPLRTQRWKEASRTFKASTVIKEKEGVPSLIVTYSLPEEGTFTVEYRMDTNGVLLVGTTLEGCHAHDVEIPRIGMRMRIGGTYNGGFEYFARGPQENYQDRHMGTLPGVYRSSAEASYYPYVRPQETGHHIDARYLALDNTLSVVAGNFEFNVLGCSIEDLDSEESSADYSWLNRTPDEEHDPEKAKNIFRKQHHINDVPVRDYVEVCIDYKMSGVGGYDSWGARTEPARCLWSDRDYSFSFALVPFSSAANKYVKTYGFTAS